MNDPLAELIRDALGLMNRSFVNTNCPFSASREFYHQFRKLWDRGIPVGMGLGHLLIRTIDEHSLGVHKLGEGGTADEALAAIRFAPPFRPEPGFGRTFAVTFKPCETVRDLTIICCDPARGTATILSEPEA